eukprot:GEMP01080721.1.p1 GENE.GEMP01080721.1~~GEMP01080721.1.p1  ORF type:complete len:236 (+),score=23.30 GEMP01080721.1:160-867(+)
MSEQGLIYREEVRAAFEVVGSLLPLILFLSPMTAINEVIMNKSVGLLPSLPFTSMFVNCFLWSLFGYKLMEKAMILPNSFGLLLACYYLKTYNEYKIEPMTKALSVMTLICFTGLMAYRLEDTTHIGNMASIASISMLSAPLMQAKNVIKTGNTAALGTVSMSLVGLCTAFTWTIIGSVYLNNFQVFMANFLGFVASCVTLMLFVIFGAPPLATTHKYEPTATQIPEEPKRLSNS